jgi:hypothetical protein
VDNTVADDLSTKASTSAPVPDGVFERWLRQPTARATDPGGGDETSTSKLAVPAVLILWSPLRIIDVTGDSMHPDAQDPKAQVGPDTWITKIWTYLKDNIFPDDSGSADRIARLTKRYTPIEGDLYQHGANDFLMQCITREEGRELLIEVHGCECGNHTSSHMLVGKSFRRGFYGPKAL